MQNKNQKPYVKITASWKPEEQPACYAYAARSMVINSTFMPVVCMKVISSAEL
jgi:hypothetical protein